jgi:type 1 glutamine amidotransferase
MSRAARQYTDIMIIASLAASLIVWSSPMTSPGAVTSSSRSAPAHANAPSPTASFENTGRPASAQAGTDPVRPADVSPTFRVLVFSKTAGFRHDSIPDGVGAIAAMGVRHGFGVDATEDASRFTDEQLEPYAVIVFLSTTGDVLNPEQEQAFERFIAKGRGFAGIHAAADTEYDWPWFGSLVGAYFKSHPEIQDATIHVENRTHPSTHHLAEKWTRRDEWYDYRDSPRSRVNVLMSLDESTYKGGQMGEDHPIAWYHVFGGGRAWYTGGGHTSESFVESEFLAHILGGIRWAAGATDAVPAGNQEKPEKKSDTPARTPANNR